MAVSARRTLGWAATALATAFGLYFVVLPCAAWLEGAYNQAQGGWSYAGQVVFDVVAGAVTPTVAVIVWRRRRAKAASAAAAFRAACWWAGLVGVPMLVLRVLASAPFF